MNTQMPKRRYVLNLEKGTPQEVSFVPKPRFARRKKPSQALRAGVLTRLINQILNRKNQND
jgi:hypothetical protein